MCGFVGVVNLKKKISNEKDMLIDMNQTLSKRGPDECGYYTEENVLFGHRRLIVIDPDGRKTTYDIQISRKYLYYYL